MKKILLPKAFDPSKARFTKRRTAPTVLRDHATKPNLQVYDDHSGLWLWWWQINEAHPSILFPADCSVEAHDTDPTPVTSEQGGDFGGGGASGSFEAAPSPDYGSSDSSSSDGGSSSSFE